ncbi:MAG: hydrogenase maturation protease [Spirochaetales bacterium]|nr:hydrogenase maturation protease [Spirochaetales bacterium]
MGYEARKMPGGVLVIGFGNPAREDDGLGPAAAEILERSKIDGVEVDIDYQLSVEHASDIAGHATVIFIDASVNGSEPYVFKRVTPKHIESFSSHSVSPEQVLGLAESLFNAKTGGYILEIRGYSFDMFKENMTDKAKGNLEVAAGRLVAALKSGDILEAMGDKGERR